MSKVQTLRAFVRQRLSAAAEEIFELFERTIAEYEEQLCRQHKLLDAVFKPQVRLHRADIQLLLDPPEQQEWSSSLDQEDPELPHIKEEQEELWSSQEGEQLGGLEEAEIIKFTFTPVPVKSEEEDDEETPQSSQLHQRPTEADGEDCGGPEPARNSDPETHLQAAAADKASHSSDLETDDSSCDWEETRAAQSGFLLLQSNKVPVNNAVHNTGETSVSSSEGATSFDLKGSLQKHDGIQTEVKIFSCSVCGKRYPQKKSLMDHMRLHSEGKRFSCPVCKKSFQWRRDVVRHMRVHTGERPFSCTICGKTFAQNSTLTSHLRVHTGEKPFTCTVCNASFSLTGNLSKHMRIHTGEKPFTCSVCGKGFVYKGHLRQHLIVHTGEKPFSCDVCFKSFTWLHNFKKHKCIDESSGSK